MRYCHSCREPWDEKGSPGFHEDCLKCRSALHVCANCRFFDSTAKEWCLEPVASQEKPRDADKANTCEYFVFADRVQSSGAEVESAAKSRRARAALEMLFNNNK